MRYGGMAQVDDQQFCLRWNNFQANITSQFETLRDDEDFTDVTIACDGQRLQAHKVVLSACSPFFKELFKTNPCSHPIIFMRDVEAQHITALMEFMYAGEVNVAQAQLSTFLKTAESLKIRGLTGTSSEKEATKEEEQDEHKPQENQSISSSSTVTSSQDISQDPTSPPAKKHCRIESVKRNGSDCQGVGRHLDLQPKNEVLDYLSDGEEEGSREEMTADGQEVYGSREAAEFGNMDYFSQQTGYVKDLKHDHSGQAFSFLSKRVRDTGEQLLAFDSVAMPDHMSRSQLQIKKNQDKGNKLIKLGEGVQIDEEQLRSVKWNDYRKLTRGLATVLFSPKELASCSVTGQRWSRAGSVERPVKPALDKARVQAIISYVTNRFPLVETSRIKQVLAYKCKENSSAYKMKTVKPHGESLQ